MPSLRPARRWAVAFALCAPPFVASAAAADAIDDYLTREMARRSIPGAAIAVVERGQLTRVSTYGLADVENQVPVSERSVFAIASLDKGLTAAGVMRLVELGRLRLDDELRRYVAGPWPRIEIRHLLSHTSGLPDSVAALVGGRSFTDYTTEDELANIRGLALVGPPGTQYLYSDANLFLAQLATEKVAGEPWRDFIRREVFAPAGMSGATFMDPRELRPGRVTAYTVDAQGRLRRDGRLDIDYGPLYNDLGLTIGDFGRWLAALDGGERPLAAASREALWTPFRLAGGAAHQEVWQWQRYGLGFGLDELDGHRVVTHSGHSGVGFVLLPDDHLAVAVFTNLEHPAGSDPIGIAYSVLGILRPALALAERPGIADPDPARAATVRAAWTGLLAGEAPLERFAPELRAAAFDGATNFALRAPLWGELGNLRYLGFEKSSAGPRHLYLAEHAQARVLLRVVLDREGAIRSFGWQHP
ncbi:MAG: serine hydrolase domain-containing protein [Thermoanaerobaculia bacterium]